MGSYNKAKYLQIQKEVADAKPLNKKTEQDLARLEFRLAAAMEVLELAEAFEKGQIPKSEFPATRVEVNITAPQGKGEPTVIEPYEERHNPWAAAFEPITPPTDQEIQDAREVIASYEKTRDGYLQQIESFDRRKALARSLTQFLIDKGIDDSDVLQRA